MAKKPARKHSAKPNKKLLRGLLKRKASWTKVGRRGKAGFLDIGKDRFDAVMVAAERSGLLQGKSGRIAGRVNPALVRQAKRQTGIETDTDLIEFALATVALEDKFAAAFKRSRASVDPALKLGF